MVMDVDKNTEEKTAVVVQKMNRTKKNMNEWGKNKWRGEKGG